MTPLLSSTHALSDQKFLLYPKLTNQKEQCKRLEKSKKNSHACRRQLHHEECAPLHLADEILVRCNVRNEIKKNPSPITVTLKRFRSSLDSV